MKIYVFVHFWRKITKLYYAPFKKRFYILASYIISVEEKQLMGKRKVLSLSVELSWTWWSSHLWRQKSYLTFRDFKTLAGLLYVWGRCLRVYEKIDVFPILSHQLSVSSSLRPEANLYSYEKCASHKNCI